MIGRYLLGIEPPPCRADLHWFHDPCYGGVILDVYFIALIVLLVACIILGRR